MRNLLKICSIISLIIGTIKLALMGYLSQEAAVFILLCGILILIGNRTVYIMASTCAGLFLFVRLYGEGNKATEYQILRGILTLAIVLFGLYIMLRGVFPASRNKGRY